MPSRVFFVDDPGWAFDVWARGVAPHLGRPYFVASNADRGRLKAPDFANVGEAVFVSWWNAADWLPLLPKDARKVVVIADEFSWGGDRFQALIGRWDRVIAKSQAIALQFLEAYPQFFGRVAMVPNGVDLPNFSEAGKRHAARPLVAGWAGSTKYHAGLKQVPEICVAAKQAEVPVRIQDAKIGQIPHGEMPGWYAELGIYVCGSLSESGPQPVLEALASGCRVVSTPVGIVPELVKEGAPIIVTAGFGVDDLAAGIREAVADRAEWPAKARQAQAVLAARWDFARIGERLADSLGSRPSGLVLVNSMGLGGATRVTEMAIQAAALNGAGVEVFADDAPSQPDPSRYGWALVNLSRRAGEVLAKAPQGLKIGVILHTDTAWTWANLTTLTKGVSVGRVARWFIVDGALRAGLEKMGVQPERIVDVHPAAAPFFRPPTAEERAEARDGAEKVMLYMGRFSGEKGLDRLVRVHAELARRGNWWLRLVGCGSAFALKLRASLQAMVHGLGTADRVEFLPAVTDNETIRSWIWGADVACMASDFEGEPLFLHEAAACGLPWVAPDVGNISTIPGGVTVPPFQAGSTMSHDQIDRYASAVEEAARQPPRETLQAWKGAMTGFRDALGGIIQRAPSQVARLAPQKVAVVSAPHSEAKAAPGGILFASRYLPRMGGAEWYANGLARSLCAAKLPVKILTPEHHPKRLARAVYEGVHTEFGQDVAKVRAICAQAKPSFGLVQGREAASVGALFARIGLPWGLIVHAPVSIDRAVAAPDFVVANGPGLAKAAAARFGAERVFTVTPTVRANGLGDPQSARRRFVTLVNLNANKGGALLPEVVGLVPDMPFWAVAGAYGPQILPERGSRIRVSPEPVSPIGQVFSETRILLLPSAEESFGMVGLEAQTVGIPVVATDLPSLRHSLGDGAVFVERTPAAIAEGIRTVLAGYETYAAAALENARQKADAAREETARFADFLRTL